MNRLRKKKGFTLAEVLMVVGILAILFAIATPNVISAQKSLRQKELDTKAETIYIAVQNKLTELYVSGQTKKYDPTTDDGLNEVNLTSLPNDYKGSYLDSNNHLYYFVDNTNKANDILGTNTLSEDLLNGHFVVEIIPYAHRDNATGEKKLTSGTVYAVYYSESENVGTLYKDSYSTMDSYRLKENRTEGKIGYYGGSYVGGGSFTESFTISSISITSNEEINKGVIKVTKPDSYNDNVFFEITLTDEDKHSVTIYYDTGFKKASFDNSTTADKALEFECNTDEEGNYIISFNIDNLKGNQYRFNSIYGDKGLVAGQDITMQCVVKPKSSNTSVSQTSASTIGNSIFAYNEDKDKNTAYISSVRHLQNLDSSSNVSNYYTNAVVLNSIDASSDDFSLYSLDYFNGTGNINVLSSGTTKETAVPKFKPISNSNLTSLSAKDNTIISNLSIINNPNSGLFGSISNNLTIENISLTGLTVSATNSAGGFVSTVENNATLNLKNAYVYLLSGSDLPSNPSSDTHLEKETWIKSDKYAGGLVGVNNGTINIENSFASTVIGNTDLNKTEVITGGLVGYNNGKLTISKSYSDSYLYGNNVGGLVGTTGDNSTITINTSYSAGYIGLLNDKSEAAGLVDGNVDTIKNVYTIVDVYDLTSDGLGSRYVLSGPYYSTVKSCDGDLVDNLFYSRKGVYTNDSLGDFKQTSGDYWQQFGTAFEYNNKQGFTYRLLGQIYSNSTYPYPIIKDLNNHGDYQTSFSDADISGNVGIAGKMDGTNYKYNETVITSSFIKDDENALYHQGTDKLKTSDISSNKYTYYVYEKEDLDVIKNNSTAVLKLTNNYTNNNDRIEYTSSINTGNYAVITWDKNNTEKINGYNVYKVDIVFYSNNLEAKNDLVLELSFHDNTVNPAQYYCLRLKGLTIQPRGYNLTLDVNSEDAYFNESDGTKSKTRTYEIKDTIIISNLNNSDIPVRDGYAFDGWYWSKEANAWPNDKQLSDVNSDQTLYAKWIKNHKVNLVTKTIDGSEHTFSTTKEAYINLKTSNLDYGEFSETITEGYTLEGWYYHVTGGTSDSYEKLFNADGSIVTSANIYGFYTGGKFIFNDNSIGDITLYAKWTKKVENYTFKHVDNFTVGKQYMILIQKDNNPKALTSKNKTISCEKGNCIVLEAKDMSSYLPYSYDAYNNEYYTYTGDDIKDVIWNYVSFTKNRNTYNALRAGLNIDNINDFQIESLEALDDNSYSDIKTQTSTSSYNVSYQSIGGVKTIIYKNNNWERYLSFDTIQFRGIKKATYNNSDKVPVEVFLFEKVDTVEVFEYPYTTSTQNIDNEVNE